MNLVASSFTKSLSYNAVWARHFEGQGEKDIQDEGRRVERQGKGQVEGQGHHLGATSPQPWPNHATPLYLG